MTYVATWESDGRVNVPLFAGAILCFNLAPLWNFPPWAVIFRSLEWERKVVGGTARLEIKAYFEPITKEDEWRIANGMTDGHDFSGVIPEDATWEREGAA